MTKLLWMADVLRNAGLTVHEVEGWQKRSLGPVYIKGIILHHTAGPLKGNKPSLDLVIKGRPDLRGPLANLFLARNGDYYIVAAGKANHAGPGTWHGVKGNNRFIGIEAENTGIKNDPWPKRQLEAYVKGVAVLADYLDLPVDMIVGHKEYATPHGRKIDPSFNMDDFRKEVKEEMARRKKPTGTEEMKPMKIAFEPEETYEYEAPEETYEYEAPEEEIKTEPTKSNPNMLKGSARSTYAKNLLMSLGWKDYQAAAMIGNAMYESNLNTKAQGDYRKGVGYTAYGIMQWRFDRLANLKKFMQLHASEQSKDDLAVQVRFIDWELRNTEKYAASLLRNSKNVTEATRAGISYCRPWHWTKAHPENGMGWGARLTNAMNLL